MFELNGSSDGTGGRSAVAIAMAALIAAAPGAAAPGSATAQVPPVAGSLATGAVVDQIADRLNEALDKATANGDFLAMRASQEALYVIDAFKKANQELLDDAFDRIGDERRALLNGLRETTRAIEEGRIDTLQKLQDTGDQMDRLVRDSTFKRQPVVYRYRGSIVTPGETQDIRLTVSGYRLTTDQPYLLFRGQRYPAIEEGDTLRFELPRNLFTADPARLKSETATLVLFARHGGFLGIGEKTREERTNINLVTLPGQLGSVDVQYTEIATVRREQPFVREESHRKSGYGGWDCRSFAHNPTRADRRFNPDRSSVRQGSGNSNGRLQDVSVRDSGISYRICARRRQWDSGPGYRHAHVNAVEVWNETENRPRAATQPLTWTTDAVFPIPEDNSGLLIKVTDFTGVQRVVLASGGDAGRYATVTYDPDSDAVLVRPKVPADLNAL
ncbi:hypothetical protein [Brevundimonas sp.]|uniref:hypothetical protein n=1 Tax=Brevundimonas sp. TaxID=1871086 RepID=UPI002D23364C|nr:hypothetical protein [Brevundimonas sp.]HYC75179.1 hypothetical protein [Brevundimonas sp.]